MKPQITLRVAEDGVVTGMHDDEVVQLLEAKILSSRRVSKINWERFEDGREGWTIRKEPFDGTAVRQAEKLTLSKDEKYPIAVFAERKNALAVEEMFFWGLVKEHESEEG